MRRLFEDFAEGEYDRPNQRWVCGLADETCPCPCGPTGGGKCPELAECQPIKVGDRWRCNRPATRGGPCDDASYEFADGGPTPDGRCCRVNKCRPRVSGRVWRGRIVLGVSLLAAGVAALVLGSPLRIEVLAPGPLAQPHAQLLARGDWANRCAACHVQQDKAILTLAIHTLTGPQDPRDTQSALCMDCHKKQMDPASAFFAHSLPAGSFGTNNDELIACAVCHQEHHGAMHDLTALSNGRCQACHQQRYNSFAGDHPDFAAWPYERRTRIVFDHVSHLQKHFPQQKQEFQCAQCHVEGPDGQAMTTLGYDAACAECHDKGLAAGAGMAMLALPILDIQALRKAAQSPPVWPDQSTGDFDGELPAAMKLLLADDPALAALLKRYGPGFSFFDIDPDSEQDLRDAAAVAQAIRRLLVAIEQRGQQELIDRLEALAGRSLKPHEARGLVAGLPVNLVAQANEAWFAAGETNDTLAPIEQAARHPAGGWFKSDATASIAYAPTGHADPLLQRWIELVVSLDESRGALRQTALDELAAPNSPGQCLTCHSVERDANGLLTVNWRQALVVGKPRGFTHFSHAPHVTNTELADCAACHKLDQAAESSASYAWHEPRDFVSHFLPMTKAACVECHVPQAAGDRCTQCHNYHIDWQSGGSEQLLRFGGPPTPDG